MWSNVYNSITKFEVLGLTFIKKTWNILRKTFFLIKNSLYIKDDKAKYSFLAQLIFKDTSPLPVKDLFDDLDDHPNLHKKRIIKCCTIKKVSPSILKESQWKLWHNTFRIPWRCKATALKIWTSKGIKDREESRKV